METEVRTRYSVRVSRNEIRKERGRRYLLLALTSAALVLIVIFALLLVTEAGA